MAKRSAASSAVRRAAQRVSSRQPRGARGMGLSMIQRSRAVSPEAKAVFNTEGRVPRDFFALSVADEAAIEATVEKFLDQALEE